MIDQRSSSEKVRGVSSCVVCGVVGSRGAHFPHVRLLRIRGKSSASYGHLEVSL